MSSQPANSCTQKQRCIFTYCYLPTKQSYTAEITHPCLWASETLVPCVPYTHDMTDHLPINLHACFLFFPNNRNRVYIAGLRTPSLPVLFSYLIHLSWQRWPFLKFFFDGSHLPSSSHIIFIRMHGWRYFSPWLEHIDQEPSEYKMNQSWNSRIADHTSPSFLRTTTYLKNRFRRSP